MARSKSYYEYVESANGDDLDQIRIDGSIMPLRSSADQKILRGEDVVWLMEAVRQRLPMSSSQAYRAIDADSSPLPLVVNSVSVRHVSSSSGEWWGEDAGSAASKFAFDRRVRADVARSNLFLYKLPDYLDTICSNAVSSVSPPSRGAVTVLANSAKTDWGTLFSAKSVASTSPAYPSSPRIVRGQPLRLDVMKPFFAAIHACTSVAFRIQCSSMGTGTVYGFVTKSGAQPPSGYSVCDVELSSTSGNLAALGSSDSCSFGAASRCANTSKVVGVDSYATGTVYGGLKSSFVLAKFTMTHVARVYGYLVMIARGTVRGSTFGKKVVVALGDATKDGDTFTFAWGGVASVESLCSAAGFVEAEDADDCRSSGITFTPESAYCIAEFDDHTYYEAS